MPVKAGEVQMAGIAGMAQARGPAVLEELPAGRSE